MTAPIDFATVQWARRRSAELEPLLALSAEEMERLGQLILALAPIKAAGGNPTDQQLTILLQHLHSKRLDSLEGVRGGLQVQFSGGGYEYERFLLRDDGRIPNHKYESKKA